MLNRTTSHALFLSATIVGLPFVSGAANASTGEEVYNKSCRMCHVRGMAGAPKTGDKAVWKERLAKGKETLYENSIKGFRDKGMMPARGGDSTLSDAEVKAAVDYMLEQAK